MQPVPVPEIAVDRLPEQALILDVREPFEWAAGHVDGAVHVPMNSVPDTVAQSPETIPAAERVYVICGVGGRSAQVTAWLRQHGFDAVNVAGGMRAWEAAGRPTVR